MSYLRKFNAQPIIYKDLTKYANVLNKLSKFPPIVTGKEIINLKNKLEDVQNGKRFILQGGHCAETFDDFSTDVIMSTFQTLVECSYALEYNKSLPVVSIGRMAGQYGKPRSNLYSNGLPNYRGDNINGYNIDDREPDPDRLITGYLHSASTMNFIRTLQSSNYYDIDFIEKAAIDNPKYESTVKNIKKALIFSESDLTTDFYISHEGHHLDYESQFIRTDSKNNNIILTTTHFPWIGERTRQLDGSHIEFFKHISNPIGIKVSHKADVHELSHLINVLNPRNEKGKIVLIIRMGTFIQEYLPALLKLNKAYNIVWMSDPMHGNTKEFSNIKTRYLKDILNEYTLFEKICLAHDVFPGGIHIEMTGENVTECIDDQFSSLAANYKTLCDPRLNRQQSIELMLNI
jgi:3-deoxy-7-phosphoheptulonate synthase